MSDIGPDTRAENLDRLSRQTFDVCVIGGGITGAGIALDAATRGLTVALVEREDFAAGTSSKSSKLVHGGLRYLANYEFGLTWESVRERDLLRRLAPHLVRPVQFLYPIFRKGREATFASLGLAVYDAYDLAAGNLFPGHRRAHAGSVRALAPLVDPARLASAYTYWDARTDDARLVFEILRTAARHGAVIANHAEVAGFDRTGGRLGAARTRDRVSNREIEVRARVFVNAAGVWADRVAGLDEPEAAPRLRPAKGVHLIVPAERLPLGCAVVFPSVARDGRSMFAIPWGPSVLMGTTDTDYRGSVDHPSVGHDDVTYLLSAANRAFGLDLSPVDVSGAYAGFRPLLDRGAGAKTADLSRKHAIARSPGGLITITGGKLTTYRRMAADAIDLVCRELGVRARCRTARVRIGLTGSLGAILAEARAVAREAGLEPSIAGELAASHGDRAPAVLRLAAEDPALAAPVVRGLPTVLAELRWATRHEMAVTLGDALERRTRLSLRDRAAGLSDPESVARALQTPPETFQEAVGEYLKAVSAERGAAGSSQAPAGQTSQN